MIVDNPKRRWWLIGAVAICVAVVAILRFTDVCALQDVSLDSMPVLEWQEAYGFEAKQHMFDQPLDSVAREILKKPNVLKVDIDYDFPDGIEIRTNDFAVVAFVVDGASGRMHCLNSSGRVMPVKPSQVDWEHPVMTGINSAPLYGICSDSRVRDVITQLQNLRESNIDLYRLIDEVYFGKSNNLRVSVSGIPYSLTVSPDRLAVQLSEFAHFIEEYETSLGDTRVLDLRYDNIIVKKDSHR